MMPSIFRKSLSLSVGLMALLAFAASVSMPSGVSATYNGGNIIDDVTLLESSTMSATAIQNFLVSKGGGLANKTFLFDCGATDASETYYVNAGAPCGKTAQASKIIYYASRIYGINPRAVLATLQKEQSLITTKNPTSWQYNQAMGYGCPTNGGCSASNFLYQIDNGTWVLRLNMERARGNMNWWWHQTTAWVCGYEHAPPSKFYSPNLFPAQNVSFFDQDGVYYRKHYIANAATSSFYCYTPHAYNNPDGLYGLPKYGTTGRYYSGSYNFVTYFEQWFGPTQAFIELQTPRWMRLKNATHKKNPATGTDVDAELADGTTIFFANKVTVNNTTYLRTKHDSDLGLGKGILLSDLEDFEPTYEPMASPRWMELETDTKKIDPITEQATTSIVPNGTKIFFSSKFTIGDNTYLRTQHDDTAGGLYGININNLSDASISYDNFTTPRWMKAINDTHLINLRMPTPLSNIAKNTDLYLDKKIDLNGQIYVINNSEFSDGEVIGVPLTDLAEITPNYVDMVEPRWMASSSDIQKTNPITGGLLDLVVPANTEIYYTSKFSVGGETYLRTLHDSELGINKAIKLSTLSDLVPTYTPMENPRLMEVRTTTYKRYLPTMEYVDGALTEGQQIFFSTKITIGGKVYLRTKHDTDFSLNKVLPYADFM